ncbi:MAG: FAD-binding protein [Sedimentisphaerales bacterium]|nr:FAD-binding protein [Sedimentisphaerales bacterium]
MSSYIVLVKQVPDVTQITDNAFDPETGTLIRTRLASVINELDTQALALAGHMRKIGKDADGQIIALTMGPPMAEEVLRYTLSRIADVAILLTDKALGGADTWATANPLAFAIKKIEKEILEGNSDYYIVSGMQSVDGDTAQVPPQIAEQLALPCVPYVTGVEYIDSRFQFTRIVAGGSQVVSPKALPAVVTVAQYEYPIFATFAESRRANRIEILHWTANDINATNIGAKGSKTAVIRVFPPGKSVRKCQQLGSAESLAEIVIDTFKSKESRTAKDNLDQAEPYLLPARRASLLDRKFEATKKEQQDYDILTAKLNGLGITKISHIDESVRAKILQAAGEHFHKRALDDMLAGLALAEPAFTGEVWVVAEHDGQKVHPATLELIGKARQLADWLETKVGLCLAGYRLESLTDGLFAGGVDNIYLIEHQLLGQFDPIAYRKAIADAISSYQPQIVLYAATPQGRVLAPMVSYRLGCGLTADCTSLDIRDSSRRGDVAILLQTRPALGGNVMATIRTKNSRVQMATARPGVMKPLPPDYSRSGNIIKHQVGLSESDIGLEIIRTELGGGKVNLDAEIIVSGGKGMHSRDNYEKLVGSLCGSLTDSLAARVERGASRAAVEQGFIERAHQVGQTGTAVGPKLYFALGISGAIQHMIGVANTETIIAINSDPNAPILKQCDYFIIGNLEDTVPELIEALEQS